MANLVKTKSYISAFSLAILSVVILFEKDFYREKEIKNWTQLTWDDFDGIPLPFTSYSAGIRSFVYIEYDSIEKAYKSYAGQNNVGSWVKSSAKHSEDLLRHEQYHFNITEYHSRALNSKIKGLGKENEKEVVKLLRQSRKELSKMQDDYDEETNHSRNEDIQRYWEFKVDSLLAVYSPENNGIHTNYLAGTKVFFPDTVAEIITGYEKDYVYEKNILYKYGVKFSFSDIQNIESQYYNIDKIENLLLSDSLQIDSLENVEFKGRIGVFSIVTDTFKYHKQFQFWLDNDYESFRAAVTIPYTKYNKGYEKIAFSILNSIEFFDSEEYWKKEFLLNDYSTKRKAKTAKNSQSDSYLENCFKFEQSHKIIFYKQLLLVNGDLALIYDIVDTPDSLILENGVINGNMIINFPFEPGLQKIRIPQELHRQEDKLLAGFFQIQDSTQECLFFKVEYLRK